MVNNKECSGRGTCLTMAEAASNADYVSLFYHTSYNRWDADMMVGCACKEGYTGFDCSQLYVWCGGRV